MSLWFRRFDHVVVCISIFMCVVAGASARAAGPILPWPGSSRGDLAVPDSLWNLVLGQLDRGDRNGRPLGYAADEMAQYGRDRYRLRPLAILFRDVRALPRFSGKLAEDLLAGANDPADLVRQGFGLTDVVAARSLSMPDSTSWGWPGVPDSVGPAEALGIRLDPAGARGWRSLPENVQRLVVRLVIGAMDAAPRIRSAYGDRFLGMAWRPEGDAAASAGSGEADSTRGAHALYKIAAGPWQDERLGQAVSDKTGAFESFESLDRDALAFGSILLLTHVQRALTEFRHSGEAPLSGVPAAFAGLRIGTPLGQVRVCGPGADRIDAGAFLIVDLGGDDVYNGRHAVPDPGVCPISLVLDLAGNDSYAGAPDAPSLACGLCGLGALIDLGGDDKYTAREGGLAAAWYGTGLLYDAGGNDSYTLETHHGIGAACAGAAVLADLEGNDVYTCGHSAEGFGETLGAGILLDVKGDDHYLARDDGNPSDLYLGQSVSMAQGVGEGRRADLGDGRSLAGGFGVLVDGAGNDSYHASAWSQGAGYWWAAGILEDLGGNDTYRNGKYSLGAGAHFALGCQVDLSGDDLYNIGNETAVNQYQGHARDGSIGVSIDGDGDDRYLFRSHCGGSGDLCSIGFFWDRRGNDRYEVRYEMLGGAPNGWSDTPPMGTATMYTPFRSWRDDLDAAGVFLDTGGADSVAWTPVGDAATADSAAARRAGDGRSWPSRRNPRSHGIGIDAVWYPPARP